MSDFDISPQFVNGPDDYYSIVIKQQNLSDHDCVFDGVRYGIPFHPAGRAFVPCLECINDKPLTLKPGQTSQHTYRWKTRPTKEGGACVQSASMDGPVMVESHTLLKPLCSDIEESRYTVAGTSPAGRQIPRFNLTSEKTTYYEGEAFAVRVALAGRRRAVRPGVETCPTLFLKERFPDGGTYIEEIQPRAFQGCQQHGFAHQEGDWRSGFELASDVRNPWYGVGEHAVQVFQLEAAPGDSEVQFAASNVLRVRIADPAEIPRT
jgi:hypothetical protein